MINMSQVQYPSDFVGVDGVMYPTVGEAFRKGSISNYINTVLKRYYSEIKIDVIDITFTEDTVNYSSELGLSYILKRSGIYSEDYNMLMGIPINASLNQTRGNIAGIGFITNTNTLYINMNNLNNITGTLKIMVVIAK